MNNPEMSNLFDILYNNITSNLAPGLNEAEKSVILTKALNMLVKEYFSTRTDGVGGGFDGSQQRQYDFSSLIKVANLFEVNTYDTRISDFDKLDRRSKVYLFPKDYFLAVNEILSDSKQQYSVLPLSYSEYQRLMLKPYNFPVKRGAWRLITNKIPCNYFEEHVTLKNEYNETIDAPQAYIMLSTWADNQCKIELTLRSTSSNNSINVNGKDILRLGENLSYPCVTVSNNDIYFLSDYKGIVNWRHIYCSDGWESIAGVTSPNIRDITVKLDCPNDQMHFYDDDTISLILQGFQLALKQIEKKSQLLDSTVNNVIKCLDGLKRCVAPSKRYTFQYVRDEDNVLIGRKFTTDIIQLPVAEIIGKFTGDVQYQLRYVRTLKPIILDDLSNYGDDFTIEGLKLPTECELPVECHQEIVERAVTLAKIAWQGGTVTQAANASREKEK